MGLRNAIVNLTTTRDLNKKVMRNGKDQNKPSATNPGSLTLTVFGEKTSLPIEVRKAVIRTNENPIPFLNKELVFVELHLVNTTVRKDNVAAKLHLALPITAGVKRFELSRPGEDGVWYPATAVPKQQAAAVVYLEKEMGRSVAAVSTSAAASNVFEMQMSPLPYDKVIRCRLEIVAQGEDVHELVHGMFPSDSITQVVAEKTRLHEQPLDNLDPKGMKTRAGAVVGTCFGKTHFCCQIPPLSGQQMVGQEGKRMEMSKINIRRMAIFQDTSTSMIPSQEQAAGREHRLRELLSGLSQDSNNNATADTAVVVEIFAFDMLGCVQRGVYCKVDDVIKDLSTIEYEGGTNLSVLSTPLKEMAVRSTCTIDAVLIITDGVDSVSTRRAAPGFDNMIPFPVHCLADGEKIDLPNLRSLAASDPVHPGTVLTRKDLSYLPGLLYPKAVLRRIITNQDEGALIEEVDDGFRCVPDHRLSVLNHPISTTEGMVITGILQDLKVNEQLCSVTELVAEVVIGGSIYQFAFQLQQSQCLASGAPSKMAEDGTRVHDCPTLFLGPVEGTDSRCRNPAKILGHLYAEEVYRQTDLVGLKSGMECTHLQQEIAVTYGFCSPESSLLMLYDREQFLEHGISPPAGHPLEPHLRDHFKEKKAGAEKDMDKLPTKSVGEIGGLKTEEQINSVKTLARNLNNFFAEKALSPYIAEDTSRLFGQTTPLMRVAAPPRTRRVARCAEAEFDVPDGIAVLCSVGSAAAPQESTQRRILLERCRAPNMPSGAPERDAPVARCAEAAFDLADDSATSFQEVGDLENSDQSMGRVISRPSKVADKYWASLEKAVSKGTDDEAWKKLYKEELASCGGHASASPSLFLNSARVLVKAEKSNDAIRIATNCLEMGIDDVQMLRSDMFFFPHPSPTVRI